MTTVSLTFKLADNNPDPIVVGLTTTESISDWNSNPNVVKVNVESKSKAISLDLPIGSTSLFFYTDSDLPRNIKVWVGDKVYYLNDMSRRTQSVVEVNISRTKVYGKGLVDKTQFAVEKSKSFLSRSKRIPTVVKNSKAAEFAVDYKYQLAVASLVTAIVGLWFGIASSRRGVNL